MTTGLRNRATSLMPSARTLRVAFQGELGAYGDEAIARRWGNDATPVPVIAFNDVVEAVLAAFCRSGTASSVTCSTGAAHSDVAPNAVWK